MYLKNLFSLLKNKNISFAGIIVGSLLFLLTYTTCLLLQSDGYSISEMILLTLLPGVYFALLVIPFYVYHLNKYIKETIKAKATPQNRFIQILLVFIVSVLVYFILDFIVYLLDNSISYDFAKALSNIPSQNKLSQDDIAEFAKEPFATQTGIVTTILGAMGALFSLIFIKKDGNLINKPSYNGL
jgi:hypothetical protein